MKLIHDFDTYDFLLSYWNLRDGTSPFVYIVVPEGFNGMRIISSDIISIIAVW